MKKIAVLISKDNDNLYNEAIKLIAPRFEIVRILRLNHKSNRLTFDSLFTESDKKVDYLINFLSPKKVPLSILEHVNIASINFHPGSYKYPGVGSASYAIYNEDEYVGVTAHYMEEDIDSGGIIAERFFRRDLSDGCAELFDKCLSECIALLNEVLELLEECEKPEIIRAWERRAITRKEFDSWMIIDHLIEGELERKIKALSHPVFPGPFIRLNGHIFKYLKEI